MAIEKHLLIIRHGKSSWEKVVEDIDRPLQERGVRDAYEMARRIADRGMIPEMMVSSPADRALHTAMIMARTWKVPESNFHVHNDLYLPEKEDLLNVLGETEEQVSSMAMFGHNPAFTEFANMLLPEPIENIPTAGIVRISFSGSWDNILEAAVTGTLFDYPKKKNGMA